MAMLNRNLRNNAAAARLLWQAHQDVSSALLWVGFVTCVTAVRAAASLPPAVNMLPYRVYLGTLAACLVGGLSTMWAAVWVAGDPAHRRAAGRIILCGSLVPMVIAVDLSNDYDVFFDMLREIA